MSETNEIDMTCKACGGTWGEPERIWRKRPTDKSFWEHLENCPADCHDPRKWRVLAELEQDRERSNVFTPEQSERVMKIIIGINTRIPQPGQRRALISLKDICDEAIDAAVADERELNGKLGAALKKMLDGCDCIFDETSQFKRDCYALVEATEIRALPEDKPNE